MHISTEKTWRGGERQAALLMAGMQERGYEVFGCGLVGRPFISELQKRFPVLALQKRGLWGQAKEVAAFVRQHGITILDAHASKAHSLALLVSWLCPQLRVVVHRRVDNPPGRGVWHRWKYNSTRVIRYVAISEAIAQVLKDSGVAAEKITVVRSAVSEQPFENLDPEHCRLELCRDLGWQPEVPIIGNVAYLTPQKGHEVLIKALAYLKAKGERFQAFIAGDGPLAQACKQQAVELQLNELVFLGVRRDVPALLLASDMIAMPSQNEGLGTSILDAYLARRPVVASAVGGIPEIIEDQETGYLLPPGDPQVLAAALQKLIRDPKLCQTFAESGYTKVKQAFSLEVMVSGNIEVYHQLMASR